MKLKPEITIMEFLKAISRCSDDIFFDNEMGDHLNLKSTLSQYIFALSETDPHILSSGHITCKNPDDRQIIEKYILEGVL